MDLTLANPHGLWALLGIPAVLLIHFLQRETQVLVISTLFLLEQLPRESAQGRRFERLRNSVPLWLQLAAVLVLTWLLVQPHWLRKDSAQRVTLVLDSSASMSAFRDPLIVLIERTLARLSAAAARTEWVVIESDTTRGTVYSGTDADALRAALHEWRPRSGTHDFGPVLAAVQGNSGRTGTVIFVTDHLREMPEGIHLLAAGAPLQNCGFAGVRVWTENTQTRWRALVRNYSDVAQERQWWIEFEGQRTASTQVRFEPGQMLAIGGAFPANANGCELVLDADVFALDDRLPMIAPEPKTLFVRTAADETYVAAFERAVASLPAVVTEPVGFPADIQFAALGQSTSAPAAVRYLRTAAEGKPLTGDIVVENHPLMEGLNWQGLLARVPAEPPPLVDDDMPLLWQGTQTLIVLRREAAGVQLRFYFDPAESNAARLPAFVVLLHRFADQVRATKLAPESANVQTNQLLQLAALPGGLPVVLQAREIEVGRQNAHADLVAMRAPESPGFFTISQGETALFHGAAQFSEPREADLRHAASRDEIQARARELTLLNSRRDPLTPAWLLIALGLCAGSWALTGRKN